MKLLYSILCLFIVITEIAYCQPELRNIFPSQFLFKAQIRNVQFLDQDFGVAVGFRLISNTEFDGVIAITNDGGESWEVTKQENTLLFGIDILDKDNIHIVGFHNTAKGILLHSYG